MSVHNSDYFIFFLYRHIFYSLDQTLKYLLKASILCFKRKELRVVPDYVKRNIKYVKCCVPYFSVYLKKYMLNSPIICSVLIVDDF